jgi:diguanylate cyclase (GGDEF)-like protein/PAS domain S-box-containing protein
VDEQQRIVLFNERAEELFRLPAERALGLPLSALLPERYRAPHAMHVRGFEHSAETRRSMGERLDVLARRADGEEFAAEVSISRTEVGGRMVMTALLRDVDERKRIEEERELVLETALIAQQELEAIGEELLHANRALDEERAEHEHRALHDPLTGLPNRALLRERLERALARARRHGWPVMVMFIDLDRFKLINDSLGHDGGDRLLRSVAERLARCARQEDTVARLGGDEFTILLESGASARDAAGVAQRLLDEIARPHRFGTRELHVTGSVGIGTFPDDGEEPDALLRAADVAMYEAKAAGGNTLRFHGAHMSRAAESRLGIEQQLRAALKEDRFDLHFQPLVELGSRRAYGAEALLRMVDASGNVFAAQDFISAAEESGVIIPVGSWAIREALSRAGRWAPLRAGRLRVAVNLSPRQFLRDDVVELLSGAADDAGIRPGCVEVELTEEALAGPIDHVIRAMDSLNEQGFHMSIDDFGVGYSSLRYLAVLPVETVKVDKSFIGGIPDDRQAAAIVEATVALAHRLGFRVLAEGVERPEQLAFLESIGCDAAQGFLFGEALPSEEFLRLVRDDLPLHARAA